MAKTQRHSRSTPPRMSFRRRPPAAAGGWRRSTRREIGQIGLLSAGLQTEREALCLVGSMPRRSGAIRSDNQRGRVRFATPLRGLRFYFRPL